MTIDISSIENKEQLEAAAYAQNCVLKDTEESAEVEGMFPTEMSGTEPGTEILAFAGYSEFEEAADKTAIKIKEGFMEMGYILKIARDTDILAGSGYGSVEEFAQRRYDLDKGTVSRYIRIVERFSEGGDSHILKENYRKMGFAKLSLMLHMPDAIAEELMESLSKNEVLAIKEELDAESMISDVELMIEKAEAVEVQEQTPQVPVPAESESLLTRAVYQFGKENQDIYRKVWKAVETADFQSIPDILAPQGDAVLICRIPGTGRVMISIDGRDVTGTAVRTGEKEKCTLLDLSQAFAALCPVTEETVEAAYQLMYGIPMEAEPAPVPESPENADEAKVAPVQPKERRKESKVTKAKPPKKEKPKDEPQAVVEAEVGPEEQIPGQDSILNHPEYMPDQTAPTACQPAQPVEVWSGQVDSTEEEATNAETDVTGVSGNRDDMPDGTGGDGTAGQPGDAAGVDRAEEEAAGSGENAENTENAIKTEYGADSEMTDKDWNVLWEDMLRSLTAIRNFMKYTYNEKDLRHNRIPKSVLETKYKEAISVATGFERILNGKKYSAQ